MKCSQNRLTCSFFVFEILLARCNAINFNRKIFLVVLTWITKVFQDYNTLYMCNYCLIFYSVFLPDSPTPNSPKFSKKWPRPPNFGIKFLILATKSKVHQRQWLLTLKHPIIALAFTKITYFSKKAILRSFSSNNRNSLMIEC